MSYRSILSNPLTSSGNIGQILNGANPSGVYTLDSGTNKTIDSITLGAGVWNVECDCLFDITETTDVSLKITLSNTSSTFFKSFPYFNYTEDITQTVPISVNIVLTFTEPTFINFIATGFNDGGTTVLMTVTNPTTTSGQYITATKLA